MNHTEIYTISEVKQLRDQAYKAWQGENPDSPVVHYLVDEGIMVGIGVVLDKLAKGGTPALTILGIYLGACEVLADDLARDSYEFYKSVYDAMYKYDYDLAKVDTGYKDTYIPPKKGWSGGVLPMQVSEPILIAFHSDSGWKYFN
ncbi:hypothetical protein [Brassicibacter mesophilus]|uniref:hypothetical protein n=1 Tax=Brassicibacter mesophilus TaxID=745119 RepID=UPI003D19A411